MKCGKQRGFDKTPSCGGRHSPQDGCPAQSLLTLLIIPTEQITGDGTGHPADERAGAGMTVTQSTDRRAARRANGRTTQRALLATRHIGAADAENKGRHRHKKSHFSHHDPAPYFALD